MISTAVFELVARGRMSPEHGAEWLMAARDPAHIAPMVWALAVAIGVLLGVC